MRVIYIFSIIFFIPNGVKLFSIPIVSDIQDMIGLANDIFNIVNGDVPFKDLISPEANPLDDVFKKIEDVTEQIENLDTKLDDVLATIISRLPLEDNINTDIRDLQQLISTVDETYDEFLEYADDIEDFNNETILEFINKITSTKTGNLPSILSSIFNIIVPKKTALSRVGLLENMIERRKMMTTLETCDSPISFQNQLFQIYNLISITEMRAFFMTAYAYRLKNEYENVKSTGETKRAQSGFIMRTDQYLIEFQKNVAKAARDIYRCDPNKLTDKNTYIEFEGLFTAFVMNEIQAFDGSCSRTCPEIDKWSYNLCYSFGNSRWCPATPCNGHLYQCEWIGGNVDICEYTGDTAKRYEWVHSYANGWYGQKTNCSGSKLQSLSDKGSGLYNCDMCICKCEEIRGASKAIRTFSLRRQQTNIYENKVVSDVKFVLDNNVIHIQIEESPLLPTGQVDRNQSSWVPLEKFSYLSNTQNGGFWITSTTNYVFTGDEDVDYAYIKHNRKVLNLDTISGGPNYVLTGVKLSHAVQMKNGKRESKSLSPLQLEVRVTPFDYANGKLNPTNDNPSKWITAQTQPKPPPAYSEKREEIKIGSKTYKYETVQNSPSLASNRFIKFQQSSIWSDAGQSTLPFLDSRSTVPASPLALDGLGLIYRGHPKYGGFVAFKALTINLSSFMDSSLTDEQRAEYTRSFRQGIANTPTKKRRKHRGRKKH
ncbi:uncharacterized protein [Chelonus insularis]|uniref:uncharacterized protein n=1 Tax=Chelonus insularis TaxID=460826 RepID=UPI00158DB780|nr:uncharacterized protein LOC118071509 [Chelonus insularis]